MRFQQDSQLSKGGGGPLPTTKGDSGERDSPGELHRNGCQAPKKNDSTEKSPNSKRRSLGPYPEIPNQFLERKISGRIGEREKDLAKRGKVKSLKGKEEKTTVSGGFGKERPGGTQGGSFHAAEVNGCGRDR